MAREECLVDLTRTDTYEGGIIPDADVDTCLKVLRTIRDAALGPNWFDAGTAVLLSHAHAKIHELVALYKEQMNAAAGDEAEQPAAGQADRQG